MGRRYAATLGYLAATLVLLRGVLMGAGIEGTLVRSVVVLVLFMLIGLVLGTIAETAVVQSVREQFEKQLRREQGEAT
jgi:pilus assembly protein TadC